MGRPETDDALVVEHLCDFEDHVGTDGVDTVPNQDTKVVNLAGLTGLKENGAFRAKPGKSKDFKTTRATNSNTLDCLCCDQETFGNGKAYEDLHSFSVIRVS